MSCIVCRLRPLVALGCVIGQDGALVALLVAGSHPNARRELCVAHGELAESCIDFVTKSADAKAKPS